MMKQTGDNYQAWKIKLSDFPYKGSLNDKLRFFLRYGILAPSIHNTQPWRFEIEGNKIKVLPDFLYYLPEADPERKCLYISLGCCVSNIESVANYFNFKTNTKVIPSQEKYIEITFQTDERGDKHLKELALYITKRYSNKSVYLEKALPKNILDKIKEQKINKSSVELIVDKSMIGEITKIHAEAVRKVGNKDFTTELSKWVRSNYTRADDGMPGFVEGFDQKKAILGKVLLKYLHKTIVGQLQKKDKARLGQSSAVGIIISEEGLDSSVDVGRLYERITLYATSLDLNTTPMYAAIMDNTSRKSLAKLIKLKKGIPFFFFRLGYSQNEPYHTPRRDLDKSLEKNITNLIDTPLKNSQIKISNKSINYIETGTGDKQLLLLHGINLGWGQWYPNIDSLAKYFKVFAIDLPGCGNSSKLDFKKSNFENDFVNVVEQFINLKFKKVNLIGHSFGGAIALRLALKNKSKIGKLILINPVGLSAYLPLKYIPISFYPLVNLLSKTALYPTKKNIRNFLISVMVKQDIKEELVEYFYRNIKVANTQHPFIFLHSLTNGFRIKPELVFQKDLVKLEKEILFILGSKDETMNQVIKSKLWESIPQAKVKIYANVGHVPSIEESDRFNNDVINFLN